jgi:hypothetical protein
MGQIKFIAIVWFVAGAACAVWLCDIYEKAQSRKSGSGVVVIYSAPDAIAGPEAYSYSVGCGGGPGASTCDGRPIPDAPSKGAN